MALKTIGTLAMTTLSGAQFSPDPNALSNADFATVAEGIANDTAAQRNVVGSIMPGAYTRSGLLWLPHEGPGRNQIAARNGKDWVAIDSFGNVFFIPQRAMPKTLTLANCTTVSGSPVITAPSSIIPLGWQNGTHVTGTNIPAGCVIGLMSANGLTFSLFTYATGALTNATGSASNVTITAGTWTHS